MNRRIQAVRALPRLLRLHQWYKNGVVFLAVFFSGNGLNLTALEQALIAFLSLSLISSAGYIVNDVKDRTQDQLHPEKRTRPLAAGMISPSTAITLSILLFSIGFILAAQKGILFGSIVGIFVAVSFAYTFFLKRIIFADIITISTLFVLRAIIGAVAINVFVSPWLILVPFFLALFLAAGKRHSDLLFLRDDAGATKKVLEEYTLEITRALMTVSITLLILSYALYSFLSEHPLLIATLPFALFTIFRFYYFITSASPIARNPEKCINDRSFVVGMMLWILTTSAIIYIPLFV
ncbi:decaprenyl-phosphate phosphoribosyltransferase [Candidatus Woesearchaeota archaeon]|nr:decaprenyl-phosphate phosphoribosyltransferase [Candidatus Woesearchaeota archaeon]